MGRPLTEYEMIFAGSQCNLVDEEGIDQFRRFESKGELPIAPTEGFRILRDGKRDFFFAKAEARKAWENATDGWFGLAHYEETMPLVIREKFLDWHPKYRK
jgi:hypothetical protein